MSKPRPHTDTPTNRFQHHRGPGDASEPKSKKIMDYDFRTHESNAWPDPIASLPADEPEDKPKTVEFSESDRKHMQQDLHRYIPSLLEKDRENKEKLAEYQQRLEAAVPTATLAGMAQGKREYTDPNRPVPAERMSQTELEREEHFKQVHFRQVNTNDMVTPTSKATRGLQ